MRDALTLRLERRIHTQRARLHQLEGRLMEASGTQHWRRWFMLAKRLDGENRELRAEVEACYALARDLSGWSAGRDVTAHGFREVGKKHAAVIGRALASVNCDTSTGEKK